ncbi:hypothetical protein ACWDKQ_34630 [Saccharopolyspora sp. NPDC000995]
MFAEQVRGGVPDPSTASLWVGVLHSVMWGASLVGSFWWASTTTAPSDPFVPSRSPPADAP